MATARCISAPTPWRWRPDQPHLLSRGRRLGGADARRRRRIYNGGKRGEPRGAPDRALRRPDRQGQLPPLHAEGDPRAAGGDRRHAAGLRQSADRQHRAAEAAGRSRPSCRASPSSPAAPPIYAGMVAKYWLEQIARLPVELDIASEFRYRERRRCRRRRDAGHLAVGRDRRTRWRRCATPRRRASKIIAVLNVPESTIAREADVVLHTLAGPEIGVASTKAFTTQLIVLAALRHRGRARPRRHRRQARGGAVRGAARSAGARRRGAEPRRTRCKAIAPRSRRRATCCSSAAAPPIRSRWKAR